MKNRINTKISLLITVTLLLLIIFGAQAASAEILKGRDYADMGELKTLKGSLVQIADEWGFRAGDVTYEIHMGPSEYRESKGFVLKDGDAATVKGFVYKTDLVVVTMETGGKSIAFRDESGNPAWSGTSFARGTGR
jgi:hypothetical protein